ncbi:hypothetical protein B0H14DRAFT_2576491 [Mycena olivaceomarginata]|nr:hypothetical protein B0H14DRAFT_2576491 [Mycena olivaceomarginata]
MCVLFPCAGQFWVRAGQGWHALRPAEPEIDPDSTESSSDSEDTNGKIVEPDPDTDTWRQQQQFYTARIDQGPSVVGGKITKPKLWSIDWGDVDPRLNTPDIGLCLTTEVGFYLATRELVPPDAVRPCGKVLCPHTCTEAVLLADGCQLNSTRGRTVEIIETFSFVRFLAFNFCLLQEHIWTPIAFLPPIQIVCKASILELRCTDLHAKQCLCLLVNSCVGNQNF